MSLFNCSKCGVIENTSLGCYWSVAPHLNVFRYDESNKEYIGKHLCSECGPKFYSSGKPTTFGTWHNKFPKEYDKL